MRHIRLLVLLFAWWLASPLYAAESAVPDAHVATNASSNAESTLRFFNRDIVTFRSTLYGVSPQDRARRAQARLQDQLKQPGPHQISQKPEALGVMLQIDGETSFWITPEDANKLSGETPQTLVKTATDALGLAIAESRESRDLEAITHAVIKAILVTVVALTVAWLLKRSTDWVRQGLVRTMQKHADRLQLGGVKLLRQERGVALVQKALTGVFRVLMFVLVYEWLSFVLAAFPFTRAWGELLNAYLWGLAGGMGAAVVNALPGLFTALVIFYLTRVGTRMLDGFFTRVRNGKITLTWLDAEVAEPSRRIAKTAIWLFALAMAYPYLPGAHTDAFRGLSVLVGLMISLGASNLVGQAASGLILIYGRVFRKGEYVCIGEHEGTVTELGMFATRIRTGLGEELTLANSTVLNTTTKNYSRTVKGAGFVLDTSVTIGYDTPWRQVHAMLEEAAKRTPGVLTDPAPQVFQTALSDWYPQYRLVCQAIPSEPRPRALILSALLANIQDVFNEYGVQIMSPQYFADPVAPKLVPPDQWFTAPAVKPDTG